MEFVYAHMYWSTLRELQCNYQAWSPDVTILCTSVVPPLASLDAPTAGQLHVIWSQLHSQVPPHLEIPGINAMTRELSYHHVLSRDISFTGPTHVSFFSRTGRTRTAVIRRP